MNRKLNTIHESYSLKQAGLSQRHIAESSMYEGLYLGRVISQSKDIYKVITDEGVCMAKISGKLRFEAKDSLDFPAVGDYVMLDRQNNEAGNGIISQILTRKSCFHRKAAGTSNQLQAVAANIDVVFICMALNKDYNLRRLERYLSVAWESGASPVVVLTKSDLCDDLENRIIEVSQIAVGVDLIVSSGVLADGCKELEGYLKPGLTGAFIGSSGVGKSTLINRLFGTELMEAKDIREGDDKGRHTTTSRELFILPDGGIVIDTPGMRELGVDTVNLSRTFEDIDELADCCKFSDCAHENEPGCAVKQAVEEGRLSPDRLESYKKLKKEAGYEGLNSRQIEEQKLSDMFGGKNQLKQMRDMLKGKRR